MSEQVLSVAIFVGAPLVLMAVEALLFARADRRPELRVVLGCAGAFVLALLVDLTPLAQGNNGYTVVVTLGILATCFLATVAALGIGLVQLARWTFKMPYVAGRLWAWAPIGALVALVVVLGRTLH